MRIVFQQIEKLKSVEQIARDSFNITNRRSVSYRGNCSCVNPRYDHF